MNLLFSMLILLVASCGSKHHDLNELKVIYGTDDRVEYVDAKPLHQEWARSTAARIHAAYFIDKKEVDPSSYTWVSSVPQYNQNFYSYDVEKTLYGYPLSTSLGLCEDEKFAHYPGSASCSGFLVGEDLLLTEAHCVPNNEVCKDLKWVFDYTVGQVQTVQTPGKDPFIQLKSEKIYGCEKIVDMELSDTEVDKVNYTDWALIKLDRKVKGRKIFKLDFTAQLDFKANYVVAGYPMGAPSVISTKAKIIEDSHKDYFKIDADTFGGNSGSPVINEKTGKVVGILMAGEGDFIEDKKRKCNKVRRCESNECKGEKVQRITGVRFNPERF